ncbi:MAG: hypothetical protein K2K57_04570 [Oscillospiraceae bacterium]|nr:hypothetical protein [Oscillospiraceae bacterium]
MDNKEVHKLVKKRVNEFLRANGFVRQDASSWVRSTDEIIQMVFLHFSYGQQFFSIDIVVQPWCIPEDMIYFTISTRLYLINNTTGKRVWGSYDEAELIADIEDALLVLGKDGFSLLDKTADCLSLINVIKTTGINIFTVDPINKARLYTYMYFYKRQLIDAYKWHNEYYELCKKYSSEENIKKDLDNFDQLALYAKEMEYEKIDGFFKALIEDNIKKLKLKCKLSFE